MHIPPERLFLPSPAIIVFQDAEPAEGCQPIWWSKVAG
jgi:hypothetical protein